MATQPMVFLGFGKHARADRIFFIEPIVGAERGSGRRTLVWVEGIPEPVVASRTEDAILHDLHAADAPAPARRPRGKPLAQHPSLFSDG